jgi:hypothetical protein
MCLLIKDLARGRGCVKQQLHLAKFSSSNPKKWLYSIIQIVVFDFRGLAPT